MNHPETRRRQPSAVPTKSQRRVLNRPGNPCAASPWWRPKPTVRCAETNSARTKAAKIRGDAES